MTEGVPHEGLTHLKEYKVEDSNVEWIGSKIDHEVKFKSAETEPAWKKVGSSAGLFVWRIEQFHVVEWPKEKLGQFHQGDSYIVLHSRKIGDQEQLQHDIFFWLGAETSQDEAGTAAYKTVELDERELLDKRRSPEKGTYILATDLHGAAVQHRELQSSPSSDFLALFPRLTILQGGAATGFRHVEEQEAERTLLLYRITKANASNLATPSAKTSTLIKQVNAHVSSLDEDDCFLLDLGEKVLIWQGKKASPIEKAKAAQVAHDMTLSRKSPQTEVIAQGDSRSYAFLEPLGGKVGDPIPSSNTHSASHKSDASTVRRPRKLFRISDESGSLRFDLVKEGGRLSKADLSSDDIFLLDTGLHIWVWQGRNASANERAVWLKVAQQYVSSLGQAGEDHLTPVAKVVEGHEGSAFQAALDG